MGEHFDFGFEGVLFAASAYRKWPYLRWESIGERLSQRYPVELWFGTVIGNGLVYNCIESCIDANVGDVRLRLKHLVFLVYAISFLDAHDSLKRVRGEKSFGTLRIGKFD